MLTHALLIVGVLAGSPGSQEPQTVVLHNEQISAKFRRDDMGLCLTEVTCPKTGKTHRFSDDKPASLFVTPPETIHDPGLSVTFTVPKGIVPGGLEVNTDQTHASIRLQNELVQVEIRYELDGQSPLLRKTIVCKAKEKPVYIAGVRNGC